MSFISKERTCAWQGSTMTQGNSSITMLQHFLIVVQVSVITRMTLSGPNSYMSAIIKAAQYSAFYLLLA